MLHCFWLLYNSSLIFVYLEFINLRSGVDSIPTPEDHVPIDIMTYCPILLDSDSLYYVRFHLELHQEDASYGSHVRKHAYWFPNKPNL